MSLARRRFLANAGSILLGSSVAGHSKSGIALMPSAGKDRPASEVVLYLCGDVMLGRGIDQIMPHPADPHLHEPIVDSAGTYVDLAERVNGAIPRPVDDSYVWGDALAALRDAAPDARIVNLETAVTRSADYVPKGINYKMDPANIGCLTAMGIDCCVLANNHVLDWGRQGLTETLDTLAVAGIKTAGAGRNAGEAQAPAILAQGKGRVVVFAFGSLTSGIPPDWAAGPDRAGVELIEAAPNHWVENLGDAVHAVRQRNDLLVASIHWGGNWGYTIEIEQRSLAHRLIDVAGFDVIYGHSSHHPKGIEIYRGKPVLYGCGDFLNDYEGIEGYEKFRSNLVLMYLPEFSLPDGILISLQMVPFRIRKFRLNRASAEEAAWLRTTLDRESRKLGCRVEMGEGNKLVVRWQ
jgi:poly-gamma-glutamate synthesis protein (capsule biosynthesis protein)